VAAGDVARLQRKGKGVHFSGICRRDCHKIISQGMI
jgi:hypothetical protein